MSSVDLTVPSQITEALQTVSTQNGGSSGLSLATNSTLITGQDVEGGAMPLVIQAQAVTGKEKTDSRILRLASPTGQYFDIGINASNNLFVNSGNTSSGSQTSNILTLSPAGQLTVMTVQNLVLSGLQSAPGSSVDLVVSTNGTVYTQS